MARPADAVRLLALAGLYSDSGLDDDDETFRAAGTTSEAVLAALRPYAERYGVFSDRGSFPVPRLKGLATRPGHNAAYLPVTGFPREEPPADGQ